MDVPRPVERARAELAAGRAWKARDRLLGAVVGYPANQAVLELLGEVLFALGDAPEAGRYWFLTARSGPDVDVATEALLERCGGSYEELARRLPLTAPVDSYPAVVASRLDRLPVHALRQRGGQAAPDDWWTPPSVADRVRDLGGTLAALGLLVGVPGLLVLGMLKLVELARSALSG